MLNPLFIWWSNLYHKLWKCSAGRQWRIWLEEAEFITWWNMSWDNGYFSPSLRWRNSLSLRVPLVMRWPLFFVREMRGQAHHWELDSPHCLPEMFWSLCTDIWKQRRSLTLERTTAAARHIINGDRDHLSEWPDNGWKLLGIFSGHAD